MTLILVPLIVYYLLVEGPDLSQGLDELIPARFRESVKALAGEIHQRLGGYIRGQLAVALVMSFLQGLAFQFLGVPYPWVLGLLAGIANVVPYSSYVTALPLALLFSALDGAGGGPPAADHPGVRAGAEGRGLLLHPGVGGPGQRPAPPGSAAGHLLLRLRLRRRRPDLRGAADDHRQGPVPDPDRALQGPALVHLGPPRPGRRRRRRSPVPGRRGGAVGAVGGVAGDGPGRTGRAGCPGRPWPGRWRP